MYTITLALFDPPIPDALIVNLSPATAPKLADLVNSVPAARLVPPPIKTSTELPSYNQTSQFALGALPPDAPIVANACNTPSKALLV
jgi:hypothetical protein